MSESLNFLGCKYNTDKASEFKSGETVRKGHDYLKYYEMFLSPFVNEQFSLVELGCFLGDSLKMWKEYFPSADIIGVDLNKNLEKKLNAENIKFICSDATSDELPAKISKIAAYDIKCIIDDCSHAWGDMRRSFEMLFPVLSSGGYYIIEDLECGTMGAYPSYPPKVQDSQMFFEYALDRMRILRVSENRNPVRFRPYFNELPQYIQNIELSIDMSMIIPGAIIFRKK